MIVDDFKSIARIANLRALDGRPQTEDKPVEMPCRWPPVEMPCDVNTDPEGWYSFMGYTAPESDGA